MIFVYLSSILIPSELLSDVRQIYSLFGDLLKSTSMGQEAKDLKVRDAKVFRTISGTTGVAILTTSNR